VIATGDDEMGVAVVRDIGVIRRWIASLGAARTPSVRGEVFAAPSIEGATATTGAVAVTPASTRGVVAARATAERHDPAPFAFPIMLEVRGRRAVVAGGGHEPAHKAAALADLGAEVIVWAERHLGTAELDGRQGIELRTGPFDPAILDDALLAIVGTGDGDVDHRIAMAARERRVLVNTVDDIPYCDWSAPAILRRGELTVSVATAGIAPALAVRVRDRIAGLVGPEHGELLSILAPLRPRIAATGQSFAGRRRLWYELVDGAALELIRAGDPSGARAELERVVSHWEEHR
jgi:siroheme synthase-like protein